jgi:hypothetical protein
MYLVLLGWLIFRVSGSENLTYAIRHFVFFDGRWELAALGAGTASPFTAALALGIFILFHGVRGLGVRWPERLDAAPRPVQLVTYFLLGLVLFLGWPSDEAPFIYFQF